MPSESWNRLGTKVLPKLKSGTDLTINVGLSVTVPAAAAENLESELNQVLEDLGLQEKVTVERSELPNGREPG